MLEQNRLKDTQRIETPSDLTFLVNLASQYCDLGESETFARQILKNAPTQCNRNHSQTGSSLYSLLQQTTTLLQQIYTQILQQPPDNSLQSLSTALTLAQMQTTSPHGPNTTVPELSDPVPYCDQSVPAPPVLGPSATKPLVTQPSTSTTHTTLDSNVTQTEADHGLNDILKSARGMGFTVVDSAKLPRLPKVRNARDAAAQFENGSIQTVIDTVKALDKEKKRNIVAAQNKKGIKTLWDIYKRTISKRKIVYEEFVRLEKNWDLFDDKYPPSSHKTFTQYHSSISTSNKIRRLELLMGEKSKPQYRDKNGNYCDKLFYKNWSENGKKLGETAIVNRLDKITDCI